MKKRSFGLLAWLCSLAGALLGMGLTAPMGLGMDAPASERAKWMGLFFLAVFVGGFLGLNLALALDRRRKALRPRLWPVSFLLSGALLFGAGFGGQLLFMRAEEEVTTPSETDMVLLLDASGSMDAYSVPRTEAACQFVDSLDKDCCLQVISFTCREDLPALDQSPMLEMDRQGKDVLKEMIAGIDHQGGTDFNAPLRLALDTLDKEGRRNCGKAVIMLTDGYGEDMPDLDKKLTDDYLDDEVKLMTIRISDSDDLSGAPEDLVEMVEETGGFDIWLEPDRDGGVDTDDMLDAFQEAFQAVTETRPAVSDGFLTGSEETSGYQLLIRTATLLVCAVLFGLGYFGCFQRKMVLNLLSGLVLSVLISLLGADAAAGGAMTCLLLASAYVTFEMDEGEVINV